MHVGYALHSHVRFASLYSQPAYSASLKAVAFVVAWCNTFLNGSCVYSGWFWKVLARRPLSLKLRQATTASQSARQFLLPARPHLGLFAFSTAAASMLQLRVSFSIGAVVVEGVRKGWPAFRSWLLLLPLSKPFPPNLSTTVDAITAALCLAARLHWTMHLRPRTLLLRTACISVLLVFWHAVASYYNPIRALLTTARQLSPGPALKVQ